MWPLASKQPDGLVIKEQDPQQLAGGNPCAEAFGYERMHRDDAVCIPEGKNRALTVIQRSRQAFTCRGAWIQFGSSQALIKAVEKTIWPVNRPWEAATPSSRSMGFMRCEQSYLLLPRLSFELMATAVSEYHHKASAIRAQ